MRCVHRFFDRNRCLASYAVKKHGVRDGILARTGARLPSIRMNGPPPFCLFSSAWKKLLGRGPLEALAASCLFNPLRFSLL